jgi:LPS sulfotransferase NodH
MEKVIPTRSYIICAMPRSGTHLLGEALENTGVAGKPDEYFICDAHGRLPNEVGHVPEIYGRMTLPEFRDFVVQFGSTPNGVFGIIIMWDYLPAIVANYRQLPVYHQLDTKKMLDDLFYQPKYIWLVRQDKVKQAISFSIALQTRIWGNKKGAIGPNDTAVSTKQPSFSYKGIERLRFRLMEAEAGWERYFQENNIQPFKVIYEELVQNYEQTSLALLAFLDIPVPDSLAFGSRMLQKQANRLNDEWEERYYQIHHTRFPYLTWYGIKLYHFVRRITVRRWLRQMLKNV